MYTVNVDIFACIHFHESAKTFALIYDLDVIVYMA